MGWADWTPVIQPQYYPTTRIATLVCRLEGVTKLESIVVIEIRSNNAVLGLYVDIRFLQKFITGYLQHIYRSSGSRYRQNFYLKPLSRTLEVLHFRVNRASPTYHARLQSRFEGAFPF